jgi:hypothetical protein
MDEVNKIAPVESVLEKDKSRRAFLRTAADVGITTAAVTVLLAGTSKPASAQANPYAGGIVNDDPNANEDVGHGFQGNTIFDDLNTVGKS